MKEQTVKITAEDIKNIEDLEKFLGREKLSKLFIQHYLKVLGSELKSVKTDDDFDVRELFEND